MFSFKKLSISAATIAAVLGLSIAAVNPSQIAQARRHYYTRYIVGDGYNFYRNLTRFPLMHWGKNYKNNRVLTYNTFWHHGHHYTEARRYGKWFGFINIDGLSTRPVYVPRRHYRKHAKKTWMHVVAWQYGDKKNFGWHKVTKAQRKLLNKEIFNYDEDVLDNNKKEHQDIVNTLDSIEGKPVQKPAKRYHIVVDGIDGGYVRGYQNYKEHMSALKTAIQIHNKEAENSSDNNSQPAKKAWNVDDPTTWTPSQVKYFFKRLGQVNQQNQAKKQAEKKQQAQQNNGQESPTKAYENSMQKQTLTDINQDRKQNGLNPVSESSILDSLAKVRANQAGSNFTHYDANNNNTPYELEDANQMGINIGKGDYEFTENLVGPWGETNSNPNDAKQNGKYEANWENDYMMNHDQDQGNGHRDNILYAPWNYVGIGVSKNGSMAEEFATSVNQN